MKTIVKKIKQTTFPSCTHPQENDSKSTNRPARSPKGFLFDSKHRRRQRPLPYMGFNAMEAIREKIYGAAPKDEPRNYDDTAMYRINLDGLRAMFGPELVSEDDGDCPYQALIDILTEYLYGQNDNGGLSHE